ncbi:spondin domain-containing protein [Ferrimonas senticii]|uniref:spondin domain-containing protein n=1 Tax=Ferrimonas senticii TaxID=394566 RepID=UPI0003FF55A2|nr:spondin domain-containing protein [Ferrimonas senticii]
MKRIAAVAAATLVLAGCPGDNDHDPVVIAPAPAPSAPISASYDITVTNLSYAQPMSPLAAYLHDGSLSGWQIGSPASVGLEELAEGGSPAAFLAEANSAMASGSGDGILPPGMSQTVSLTVANDEPLYLTLATMLVNTNDAFAGRAAIKLHLAIGEQLSGIAPSYDAGTEANSELAATIPGPAGGGAGFDSSRDDIADYVTRHGGIVGIEDGASDSALTQAHRFDNPVLHWSVTRSQ